MNKRNTRHAPHIRTLTISIALLVAIPLIAHLLHPAFATLQPAAPPALEAQPEPVQFFGINTYFTGLERFWNDGDEGILTLVEMGRESGATWGREEISWANLQYARGMWNRDNRRIYDQHILEMAEADYGIIGMLLTTPDWAVVSDCEERLNQYDGLPKREYWCPPADVQDYADFVQGIVERYDGDGNDDAPGSPRIAVWQIWNEPNHWETWPGTAAEYAALLKAGYAAVKAADPTALVVTAGLYVLDGESATDGEGCGCHKDGLYFFDQVLAADPTAWEAFDALAIHPYMPYDAPTSTTILAKVTLWGRIQTSQEWLAARQQQYGGPSRPLWISEVGWTTCDNTQAALAGAADSDTLARYRIPDRYRVQPDPTAELAQNDPLCKTEQEQAAYMVQTHNIALALGVQHLNFHQLEDKFDTHDRDIWQGTAIVNTIATNYAPKLAYDAYQVMTEQLTGATFIGTGALHSYVYDPNAQENAWGRYHMRFRTADGLHQIDVLWDASGAQQVTLTLEPEAQQVEVVLMDGQTTTLTPVNGMVGLNISENPIYVRQELPPPTPTPTGTPLPTSTPTPSPTPSPTPLPGDAYEPDNTCTTTRTLTVGNRQPHTFHLPDDTDWTRIAVVSGTTYLIEAQVPPDSPAMTDPALYLACDGDPVATWEHDSHSAWLTYQPDSNDTLLLRLASQTADATGVTAAYNLSVCALPDQPSDAFIIVAGGVDDPVQANIDATADMFRAMLNAQGHPAERVLSLTASSRPFSSTLPLQTAITSDTLPLLNQDSTLTLYMVGAGNDDVFYLDRAADVRVTASDLNTWLTDLEAARPGVRVNVVLESPQAGSFIADPQSLSFPGRVIVASSGESLPAYTSVTGTGTGQNSGLLFSDYFISALWQGASIASSFEQAASAVQAMQGWTDAQTGGSVQVPWLDDNGDSTADSDDGTQSNTCDTRLVGQQPAPGTPPLIDTVEIADGNIRARFSDDESENALTVVAAIYPPGTSGDTGNAPVSSGELFTDTTAIRLTLLNEGASQLGHWYGRDYAGMSEPGTYRVVVAAQDEQGQVARPVLTTVEVQDPDALDWVYLPLVLR